MELGEVDEGYADGLLGFGDGLRVLLDARRAGGRSEKTVPEYRKKLELPAVGVFGLAGEGTVDAPVSWVGPDEVEGYGIHTRKRGLSNTSVKDHLSVVRGLFHTLSRRLDLPAKLMGHSNLSQVRKYALFDAERARAGVAKL